MKKYQKTYKDQPFGAYRDGENQPILRDDRFTNRHPREQSGGTPKQAVQTTNKKSHGEDLPKRESGSTHSQNFQRKNNMSSQDRKAWGERFERSDDYTAGGLGARLHNNEVKKRIKRDI